MYESLKKFKGVQIYQSKNRRYNGKPDICYYIRYKNTLEKNIREKIGWASEGITAAYAAQIRSERIRNMRLGDEAVPIHKKKKFSITFCEFMEEKYFPYVETDKVKSLKTETYIYNKWLKESLCKKELKKISSFDLEKIKKNIKDAGKSPRTINYALDIVRMAYNKAIEWGFFEKVNPASKIKRVIKDNKRIRFLTPEEAKILLEECRYKSEQLYEICLLSLYAGLRAGEIFNLQWSDLDFDNEMIQIKDTKNHSNRVAYMTQEIKDMLLRKKTEEASDFIFKNRNGSKIDKITKTFRRIVDDLGFNDGITDNRNKVVFHTLRHTFASWLAIQGTPIYTIKELMGHKTLAMTERYSHLIPDVKRQAVAKLANIEIESKFQETKNRV